MVGSYGGDDIPIAHSDEEGNLTYADPELVGAVGVPKKWPWLERRGHFCRPSWEKATVITDQHLVSPEAALGAVGWCLEVRDDALLFLPEVDEAPPTALWVVPGHPDTAEFLRLVTVDEKANETTRATVGKDGRMQWKGQSANRNGGGTQYWPHLGPAGEPACPSHYAVVILHSQPQKTKEVPPEHSSVGP
jgi:hypothetical protein